MRHFKQTLKVVKQKQNSARRFDGGLDLVDTELNLSSRFAVGMVNCFTNSNGDWQVRWGTRKFAQDLNATRFVAATYFFAYLIMVNEDGTISAVNGAGTVTTIWNSTIARALSGSPSGWGTTSFASFTPFQGSLVVCNGSDKPIIISSSLGVQYLQDLGTGSNINTPIAKYVISHGNYTVMAGIVGKPGRIAIANLGTSGTWVGDPAPNDAIIFDVDKYVQDGSGEITGLASFRDKLVVFFNSAIVTLKLGIYSSAATPVHTPQVVDNIENFGAVCHNGIINTGDNLFFLDYTGVNNLRRALVSGEVVPERSATLVDQQIQRTLSTLSRSFIQKACYAVYDKREERIAFMLPQNESTNPDLYMIGYVVSLKNSGRDRAWHIYTGWQFQCGCVSAEGRVFFGWKNYIIRRGSQYEPVLSDYEGILARPVGADVANVWVNDAYCPDYGSGVGIDFEYEMPYSDLQQRAVWKTSHYISFDTKGASRFTVQMYIDDLEKRSMNTGSTFSDGTLFTDGFGWSPQVATPNLSMDFIAGDRGAYNAAPGTVIAPNNRYTDNQQLYHWPSRFKLFKIKFKGTSYSHLRMVAVTLHHTMGSIY